MELTKHASQRIQQRVIPKALLDLVMEYGEISGDKYKLNKKKTIIAQLVTKIAFQAEKDNCK